jgi:hypothetical protein
VSGSAGFLIDATGKEAEKGLAVVLIPNLSSWSQGCVHVQGSATKRQRPVNELSRQEA